MASCTRKFILRTALLFRSNGKVRALRAYHSSAIFFKSALCSLQNCISSPHYCLHIRCNIINSSLCREMHKDITCRQGQRIEDSPGKCS
jgi:hypothetical protein